MTGDKLVSKVLSEQGRANFDLMFGVKSCAGSAVGSNDTSATLSESKSISGELSEEFDAVQPVENPGTQEIVKNEKSCYTCKHRHSHEEYESWEMSHIRWWEHACAAHPKVANLKQFPFNTTKCKLWEPVK